MRLFKVAGEGVKRTPLGNCLIFSGRLCKGIGGSNSEITVVLPESGNSSTNPLNQKGFSRARTPAKPDRLLVLVRGQRGP